MAVLGVKGFAAAGGLAGIAAVLTAFFRRHSGKSIHVKYLDAEVEVNGMSVSDSAEVVTNALEAVAEQGKKNAEEWKKFEQE